MAGSIQDASNPFIAPSDEAGGLSNLSCIGKQDIDVRNTILASVSKHRIAHRLEILSILNNFRNLGMAQGNPCMGAVLNILLHENVTRHRAASFMGEVIIVIIVVGLGHILIAGISGIVLGLRNQIVQNIALLFVHRFDDILDSLFAISVGHGWLLRFICMLQNDWFSSSNNCILFGNNSISVRMCKTQIVDDCSGIRTCNAETNFSNSPMHHVISSLRQLIGINGQ